MGYRRGYKGETTAKKVQRFILWRWILTRFDRNKHPGVFHVLASREAGDVSFLRGIGVPPSMIHAYEHNAKSKRIAQARFPDVHWHDDLADMESVPLRVIEEALPKGLRGKRDIRPVSVMPVAYLDFCSPINQRTLNAMIRTGSCFGERGILAVNVLKGREYPSTIGERGSCREVRGLVDVREQPPRHMWRKILANVLEGREDYATLFRYVREHFPQLPPAVSRIGILTEALRLGMGFDWQPVAYIEYSSGVSPMLTVVFELIGGGGPYTCFSDITLVREAFMWRHTYVSRGLRVGNLVAQEHPPRVLPRAAWPFQEDMIWEAKYNDRPGPAAQDWWVQSLELPPWEELKAMAVNRTHRPALQYQMLIDAMAEAVGTGSDEDAFHLLDRLWEFGEMLREQGQILDWASMLNVPPSRLAAWRAVATRTHNASAA